MHSWGGGVAQITSSGMADGGLVTKVNHFYNGRSPRMDVVKRALLDYWVSFDLTGAVDYAVRSWSAFNVLRECGLILTSAVSRVQSVWV